MKLIHVFIADDHDLIRKALRDLIAKDPTLVCVGEASNAIGLQEQIAQSQPCPDILLMDLSMPGLSSPSQMIQRLKKTFPELQVVIISSYNHEPSIQSLLMVKIAGYILKDDTTEELVAGLKKVANEQVYYSSKVVETITRLVNQNPFKDLTARELEVFQIIHLTNTEIAERLCIAEYTVRTHINRINVKMGFKSRFSAIQFALDKGYIQTELPKS